MDSSHPALISKIHKEIRSTGPMTFARFMDLALYEPTFGYYMRGQSVPGTTGGSDLGQDGIGEDRIGWSGDYFTSGDLPPFFAEALARQLDQMDELLGRPTTFTVVEMGAGKGLLARDILKAAADLAPSARDRWRYILIERSQAMRAAQRTTLESACSLGWQITWVDRLDAFQTDDLVGVMFSNELVDAFPVHRVKVQQGRLMEIHVDLEGERLFERLLEPSTPDLARYFRDLAVTLPEGQLAEVNLEAVTWMREVARILRRGFVITIDYGHTAQDLFDASRRTGTLLCYYRHKVSEDPYERIGLQDMTTHADFTSLAATGEAAGLSTTGFTNHLSFLSGLGIERALERLDPRSPEFQAAVSLLDPRGMGTTFKVLIQHKGMDRPELDGLRFKPFFDSALMPPAEAGRSTSDD